MGDKDKSEDIFREFFSRRESGEDVNPEEYYRKYPELEADLRNLIDRLTDKQLEDKDIGDTPAKPPHIIGDFKIIKEIGRGGMGTVYEAEQISLNRNVALKVLPSHLSFSDEAVLKFKREAEAGGRQSHPGIVAIHAVGEHEGVHYIAQELVGGGVTLNDKLEDLRKTGEQSPGYFREVARLIAEIADSLQHAHDSGVIHRDIKPSNILLSEDGKPKITDFGLAKIEDALALSRTGDFAGTPYYMSPEQAMSRRIGIDKRTDIYSLGVTLYEMLTMKRPFEGETSQEVLKKILLIDPVDPHKTSPRVSRDLSTICLKAMEKLPEKRYQTMEEFIGDLQRFLSGDVILAKSVGPGARFLKRLKRNPVLSGAVGAALAAVLALIILIPWFVLNLNEEKKVAVRERQTALEAKGEAEAERREAERQREIAENEKRKAISERNAKEKQLLISEGHRLAVHSSMVLPNNPDLALLLAIESAERNPGLIANIALLDAIKECRECRTLVFDERIAFDISPDGERFLTVSKNDDFRIWNTVRAKEIIKIEVDSDRYGRISSAKFSPDGKKVLMSHKNTARIWDAVSGKEIVALFGHEELIQDMQFSPDGKKVATSSSDRTLRIWDTVSGKEIVKINLLKGYENFDFSPDGTKIVIPYIGGRATIWDAVSGKPIVVLHGYMIHDVVFSPDGTKVVTRANDNKYAQVFDAVSGKEICRIGSPGKEIYRVKFSPDGAMIVTITQGGIVQLLDPVSGREIRRIGGPKHSVNEVNFSSDRTEIVTASIDGTFQIWDAESGRELIAFQGQRGKYTNAHFCSDNTRIVTISYDKNTFISIWNNSQNINKEIITLSGHEGAIWDANYSSDGKKVITVSIDNTARIWKAETGMNIATIREDSNADNTFFRIAEFDPNSEKVLTVIGGSAARIWDLDSCKKIVEFDVRSAPICKAGFSPDGSKVITGATDATVQVWDIKTGKALLTLGGAEEHDDNNSDNNIIQKLMSVISDKPSPPYRFFEPLRINLPNYSPDGMKIITGEVDGTFRIYDASTGEILVILKGHQLIGHALSGNFAHGWQHNVTDASFTYDGRMVITFAPRSIGKDIKLWDVTTGMEISSNAHFRGIKHAFTFNPDGTKLLGINNLRNEAQIWDVASGKEIVIFKGHEDELLDARFSPDSKLVVTASLDRTARIWNAVTGKEIITLRGQVSGFRRAVFSPDGERVLTASDDGTATIWPVDPLVAAKRLKSKELTSGERKKFNVGK